ncbi:hypothetical protein FCL40_07270 [Ferrimonas sediminicola]|uniref:Uncharacterized protein n=1 Tax=Ferrimonas sediminicola TaxID=2569538 RepID=A0A4U1BG64_9GAMM|nr:hypothetical protein [Ferrimonas sediminicola]TKB49943.1 hypothetical protein FCL40_07270 [Ferrimonas sediminicola]
MTETIYILPGFPKAQLLEGSPGSICSAPWASCWPVLRGVLKGQVMSVSGVNTFQWLIASIAICALIMISARGGVPSRRRSGNPEGRPK